MSMMTGRYEFPSNSRHFVFRLWATAILALAAIYSSMAMAGGDWVNDWFAQSASTPPGQFETQQRGYYTAGGFDGRFRMTNDYLVSVQPPSIKVGCGGIDMMAGSLAYLNPQYLVQKLERILQAAPAFAFDIAMQEYCKPCVSTLQYLDHTANQLNQFQMNDCQATQKLATAIVDPSTIGPDLQGLAASTTSQINGLVDTWENFQTTTRSDNGASPVSTAASVSGCSQDFINTFTNGSIIQNSSNLIGLSTYAPLMRGLVGDVIVTFDSTQNLFNFQFLNACAGNDSVTGDDFFNGTVKVEDSGGNCTQPSTTSVIATVDSNLNAIAAAIQGGTPLTSAQIAFVNNAPIPLYLVFRDASLAGNVPQMVSLLDNNLAQGYTAAMLTDFYQSVTQVLNKADEVNKQTAQGAGGNPNACSVSFLQPAIGRLQELRESALKYRGMAQQAYAKSTQETVANLELTQNLYQQHVKLMNGTASVADHANGK